MSLLLHKIVIQREVTFVVCPYRELLEKLSWDKKTTMICCPSGKFANVSLLLLHVSVILNCSALTHSEDSWRMLTVKFELLVVFRLCWLQLGKL